MTVPDILEGISSSGHLECSSTLENVIFEISVVEITQILRSRVSIAIIAVCVP